MKIIENSRWRYATKKMDPAKKVTDNDLETIKEAIRLSASSYGLQPYKVLVVTNEALKEKLKPFCWNQSQVADASHVLVFCNQLDVKPADIEHFVRLRAKTNGFSEEQGAKYSQFVWVKLKEKSREERFHWTAKQAYIALGNAMQACAELRIDCTPMEGFEASKVNELFDLEAQGYNACVLLPIGYRSNEDAAQHAKKVRKPMHELFEEIVG